MPTAWTITNMTNSLDGNGDPEFILDASWDCIYTHPTYVDERGAPLESRAYGTVAFPDDHDSRQVPWSNINENQVIAWVKSLLNVEQPGYVASLESGLNANAESRGNPSTSKGKPW
jgi:hypothetical protein